VPDRVRISVIVQDGPRVRQVIVEANTFDDAVLLLWERLTPDRIQRPALLIPVVGVAT
jgi:hypothetical protein